MSVEKSARAYGSKVKLIISPSGVPQHVMVDGVLIAHAKCAQVILDPGAILTLHLDIYVSEVETQFELQEGST